MPQGERIGVARELVLLGIGVFIVLIWGIAVMVQVISPSHVVPTEVHGVALVVATGFFSAGAIAGWRKGQNNGS